MTLFKLKKDGEMVGYLNIDKGIHWSDETSIPWKSIDFDTAHSFVCKDKNKKDVFADDPCLLHCFSPPKKVYPRWNQDYLRFELWENETAVMAAVEDTYKRHIELIEEKKE